jgi:hypothetical protein
MGWVFEVFMRVVFRKRLRAYRLVLRSTKVNAPGDLSVLDERPPSEQSGPETLRPIHLQLPAQLFDALPLKEVRP